MNWGDKFVYIVKIRNLIISLRVKKVILFGDLFMFFRNLVIFNSVFLNV